MFEKSGYHCPRCGYEIAVELADGAEVSCDSCGGHYRVMLDEQTGKVAFYEQAAAAAPEPLYLPPGSLRALGALTMAGSCWWLVLAAKDVPGSLLSLVLAIVGYYFGFRTKAKKAAGGGIYDPTVIKTTPLGLPSGAIRQMLIVGFVVSAAILYFRRDGMADKYVDFFVVLFGLIAGHLFAKAVSRLAAGKLTAAINHAKGAVMLAVLCMLTIGFVSGSYVEMAPASLAGLCAVASFYYGSRT